MRIRHEPIRQAWDEADNTRWTQADQRMFEARFREWARRTGNQTSYEIRLEQGDSAPFKVKSRRRRA